MFNPLFDAIFSSPIPSIFSYGSHSSSIPAGGRVRHAFIGIGFRERTEAYDFQAALHDHMKYFSINYKQFSGFYPLLFSYKL